MTLPTGLVREKNKMSKMESNSDQQTEAAFSNDILDCTAHSLRKLRKLRLTPNESTNIV